MLDAALSRLCYAVTSELHMRAGLSATGDEAAGSRRRALFGSGRFYQTEVPMVRQRRLQSHRQDLRPHQLWPLREAVLLAVHRGSSPEFCEG
eukprot:CAMPEP_0170390556 /NCGR_PEP_ID=MMETSP0117_2-20130122/19212_1 /TAXON_ID=400756 /ORGANISM="Durinskia baltica, Strain CSIRO CS-38" /LENGTH=91 /DNA_ID=CAMNT_0010646615 /DNA_START=118 /DNA_END=393 /DNA_ORIENTATION=+